MQEKIHDQAMIAAVCAACSEAHGVNFFEAMLLAFAEIHGETSNPKPKPR
ncbi:hypothetical protein MLD59_05045 [Verrucomicrobiaceae bacterium E54]|nr:hypothetical protein [Verrucomicrobiaceae bacterium E54]